MDKKLVFKLVVAAVEEELRRQLKGQAMAAEGATHAEARAETKWDTCGLEQSYLARGLAQQFETLAQQFENLRNFNPPDFTGQPIGVGALVETEMGFERDWFFLLECGGGTEVEHEGRVVTVITPESPLGNVLAGRREGDAYALPSGMEGRVLHVE